MKSSIILALLLLLCPQFTDAQSLTPAEVEAIDQYITERLDPDDPGLAYGVVRNGDIVHQAYFGLASLQHEIPVTAASRFNIASVAKQFTALLALKLVMEGKLTLDEDFRTYLPGYYPDIKDPIRIRHLLNHSSGIPDYPHLLSIQHKPWWRQVGMDNADVLALLSSQQHLNFSPGTAYVYSNSNYTLLAQLVEVAADTAFHAYARQVFDQLDMPHTGFNKNYMNVIPQVALPYSDWGNGVWQQYPHMTNLYGDGFLYTTLEDQLRYEQAIQNAVVSEHELLMVSQHPVEGAAITNYGYGLELQDRMGRPAVHHSGGTGSYHAQTVRFPESNLSIVVMSNNSQLWSGYVADHIASILLPALPAEANRLDPAPYGAARTPSQLAGEYVHADGTFIRIKEEAGTLSWKRASNNALSLVHEAGNVYQFAYDLAVKLGFQDGQVVLHEPATAPRRYTKLPAFTAGPGDGTSLAGTYHNAALDVNLKLSAEPDNALFIYSSARKRTYEAERVHKDHLLWSGYTIKLERNAKDEVVAMALSTNRVHHLRFEKVGAEAGHGQ